MTLKKLKNHLKTKCSQTRRCRAPSEKGEKTRQSIMQAAFDLFHAHGVHNTSVDDVLKASSKGKSQFYHYFKSKDDLISQTLQFVGDHMKEGGDEFYRRQIKTWADLKRYFNDVIENQQADKNKKCCPFITIGNDLEETNHPARAEVSDLLNFPKENIKSFLSELKKKDKLKKNTNIDSLAEFTMNTLHGGSIVAKIQRDIKPLKDAADHAYKYLSSYKA